MKKTGYTLFIVIALSIVVSCMPFEDTTKIKPQTIEITRIVKTKIPALIEITDTKEVVTTQPIVEQHPLPLSRTPMPYQIYTGTYVKINGQDFNEDGGCIVKFVHENLMEPFDNLSFELSCNRGAPSYNMGYASDTIIFENSATKMAVWSSPFGECHLVFEFSTLEVVISQIGHSFDCGFGFAVYANGTYLLTDDTVPELGCMNPNPSQSCPHRP